MDINSICKTQLTDMKNEYFQNDVIDLRILSDIGSVCIYHFPRKTQTWHCLTTVLIYISLIY